MRLGVGVGVSTGTGVNAGVAADVGVGVGVAMRLRVGVGVTMNKGGDVGPSGGGEVDAVTATGAGAGGATGEAIIEAVSSVATGSDVAVRAVVAVSASLAVFSGVALGTGLGSGAEVVQAARSTTPITRSPSRCETCPIESIVTVARFRPGCVWLAPKAAGLRLLDTAWRTFEATSSRRRWGRRLIPSACSAVALSSPRKRPDLLSLFPQGSFHPIQADSRSWRAAGRRSRSPR